MDMPLRIAVVGASGHAARVAAPTIATTAGTELAGVLGSTQASGERLAARHPGARAYADWAQLEADRDTAAVWVASPNHLHPEFARRCLRAGKHVLVEKPLATRADEAQGIAELAASTGLVAAVGYQHRFRPGHRWLHGALRDGLIGRPRLLRIHRFWPYPYFPDMPADIGSSWRSSVDGSGGWALNDIGSHLVDLALWLLGQEAELAFSRTSNFRFGEVEAEDTAVLVADAADGAVVVIDTSNAMGSYPGTIDIHGSDGWLRAEGTFDDEGAVVLHDGTRHEFATSWAAVYQDALRDFADRVAGRPALGATAAEAVATTRIIAGAAARHRSA
jgi:1,5-anhydro-D-fructose reductase (1,5-anhydro-D-mannitol-forming)